jgi:hypothetical protein
MRDWTMIPALGYALLLAAAGVVIPLVLGFAARVFVFRPDPDDERNDPVKARQLKEQRARHSLAPEQDTTVGEPWPEFSASDAPRRPGLATE